MQSPAVTKKSTLTSRGICKAFIIYFLEKLYRYIQILPSPVHFPLLNDTTQVLLDETKDELSASTELRMKAENLFCVAGECFNVEDIRTYWTTPSQFKTWWKNNIERKSRLASMQKEIQNALMENRKGPRINFKLMAVYLSENIRAYSFRQVLKNSSIVIPYELPPHLLLCEGSHSDSGCRKKSKIYGKFSSPSRPILISEDLRVLRRELFAGSLEDSTKFLTLSEQQEEDIASRQFFGDGSAPTNKGGSFLRVYTTEGKIPRQLQEEYCN